MTSDERRGGAFGGPKMWKNNKLIIIWLEKLFLNYFKISYELIKQSTEFTFNIYLNVLNSGDIWTFR